MKELDLNERAKFSNSKIEELKDAIQKCINTNDSLKTFSKDICVYVTGSFARDEAGDNSDLDIFSIGKEKSKLNEILLFSELIKINDKLKFPPFSNDGQYLTIFNYSEHKDTIGSPEDDHNNWFTARMLLLLESKCLYNTDNYDKFINDILDFYFRDCDGKDREFNLFFILNDILRFWRTLCLNYELGRTKNKPWKKKNINLKFSRRLMVFSTIIYLCILDIEDKDGFLEMIKLSPIERLRKAIDKIDDKDIKKMHRSFEEEYKDFLNLKDRLNDSTQLEDDKSLQNLGRSNTLRTLVYNILTSEEFNKNEALRHFLVS